MYLFSLKPQKYEITVYFLLGIKNIRFPPASTKPPLPAAATAQKSSVPQDDDVIFISPPTSPIPPPLTQQATPSSVVPVNSINLPSSVSLIKKSTNTQNTNNSALKPNTTITPNTTKLSENNNGDRPKTFLRVKSLTALQNVPSECITIPDDPLPPPPPLTPIQKNESSVAHGNGELKDSNNGNADIVEIIDDKKDDKQAHIKESWLVNGVDKGKQDNSNFNSAECITYSLKEPHSQDLNKIMKGLKILLEKSVEIDELIKTNPDRIDGYMSD